MSQEFVVVMSKQQLSISTSIIIINKWHLEKYDKLPVWFSFSGSQDNQYVSILQYQNLNV